MMDFSLKLHDLHINNGDISLCPSDDDAVAQAIAIRLKTFAGEWFLDENQGLPYLTHIFGKKLNERYLRNLIVQEIKAIAGVSDVQNLIFKPQQNQRRLLISFNAILSNQKSITIDQTIGA